jgi:hypothetical protein
VLDNLSVLRRRWLGLVVSFAVVVAAGCGGGGDTTTAKSVSLDLHGGVELVVLCRKPVTPACRRERRKIEALDRGGR